MTVRRLIPSRRAISRCESPSAASVLTCAHSNALRTSCLLARHRDRAAQPQQGGGRDQRRREWCTFRLPILAQYWAARVNWVVPKRRHRPPEQDQHQRRRRTAHLQRPRRRALQRSNWISAGSETSLLLTTGARGG